MQGIENYPQIFMVSTLIMLALVGFIIFFVMVYHRRLTNQRLFILEKEAEHQQKLLSATIQTQEIERQRIARDLHDEIGAMLSAVKMKVSLAKRKAKDHEVLSPLLGETSELLTDSIQNVRHISHALLPPLLDKFGLGAALKSLIEKSQSDEGPIIAFRTEGESRRLSEEEELGLYRVSMEIINNALKHAQAKHIFVRLEMLPDKTELEIKDDGVGFDFSAKKASSSGLGLKNIESRVLTIGGNWEFNSEAAKGTQVKITLTHENSPS